MIRLEMILDNRLLKNIDISIKIEKYVKNLILVTFLEVTIIHNFHIMSIFFHNTLKVFQKGTEKSNFGTEKGSEPFS